jgi:hypothetical protein
LRSRPESLGPALAIRATRCATTCGTESASSIDFTANDLDFRVRRVAIVNIRGSDMTSSAFRAGSRVRFDGRTMLTNLLPSLSVGQPTVTEGYIRWSQCPSVDRSGAFSALSYSATAVFSCVRQSNSRAARDKQAKKAAICARLSVFSALPAARMISAG